VPTQKTKIFTTTVDGQTKVTFPVYQGERPMTKDNIKLGEFDLDGVAPQPRGVPELLCTFDLDANGILKVSAQDKTTGRKAHVTIQNSTRLSSAEIDRLVAEAAANSEADKARGAAVEAKQELEGYIYQIESTINEPNVSMKLKRGDKQNIETALADATELLDIGSDESDAQKIKDAHKKLQRTVTRAFASLSR
jgi:L1 cell adhesion molecule like protein